MNKYGHPVHPGGQYDGHRHKAAFGKYDIWLLLADNAAGLPKPFDHLEGVLDVLPIQITPQLARCDRPIGDVINLAQQLPFDSVFRAYVIHAPAFSLKERY
ncbi:hypothetical protein D3C85_1267810 [compost metagenome]